MKQDFARPCIIIESFLQKLYLRSSNLNAFMSQAHVTKCALVWVGPHHGFFGVPPNIH